MCSIASSIFFRVCLLFMSSCTQRKTMCKLLATIVKVQCRILTSLMAGGRKILLVFLSEVEASCLMHSTNALRIFMALSPHSKDCLSSLLVISISPTARRFVQQIDPNENMISVSIESCTSIQKLTEHI
jgi:hypothetical protein